MLFLAAADTVTAPPLDLLSLLANGSSAAAVIAVVLLFLKHMRSVQEAHEQAQARMMAVVQSATERMEALTTRIEGLAASQTQLAAAHAKIEGSIERLVDRIDSRMEITGRG